MTPRDDGGGPFPQNVFPESIFPRRIFPWKGGDDDDEDEKKPSKPEWERKKDGDD